MQSYPSPLFEIVLKEQVFFHLKCKAISSTNLTLHEEGAKLFFPFKCTFILPTRFLPFNDSQLAKMEKSIPDMSLPWNL